jgi:hypothetical protein
MKDGEGSCLSPWSRVRDDSVLMESETIDVVKW